jgi:hypothetical protein
MYVLFKSTWKYYYVCTVSRDLYVVECFGQLGGTGDKDRAVER